MHLSEKVYRFLLRAYPRPYRERYREPMAQLFRDGLRDANTPAKAVAFWMRMVADWALSVPARHWERLTSTPLGTLAAPARRCVFFARYEAGSFAANEIKLEHLLLGLLRQDRSLVPAAGVEAMRRAIEAEQPARHVPPRIAAPMPLSTEVKRALAAAGEIAGCGKVTPRDLAHGILRAENTLAARLLREYMRN